MQAALDKEWIDFAETLADAAGGVARRYFRKPVATETKSDHSPVTQADREVESAIRALIDKRFPDHGIFGEEHGRKNTESPWQWVIDPIDGTRAFLAGYPWFTTLIALTHHDVPVLGVIDQPVLRERWVGAKGLPTRCNGAPVSVRKLQNIKQAILGTTSAPYLFSEQEAAAFDQVKEHSANFVQGGDAYGYAMLASGQIDLFIDSGFKPYDFCALAPVVEGAGGVISDWEGKPLTIRSEGHIVATASAELHKQAIALLKRTAA